MPFDLAAEVDALRAGAAWSSGRSTRMLVKHEALRVVLMALRAGSQVPEHSTDGDIAIQVLSGHVHVAASGQTFSLRGGALLTLERNVPHQVDALEESAFLLTIARSAQP